PGPGLAGAVHPGPGDAVDPVPVVLAAGIGLGPAGVAAPGQWRGVHQQRLAAPVDWYWLRLAARLLDVAAEQTALPPSFVL
ncbi:MAG: hypothetical protein WAZ19_15070, partial [Anaerolineae bacterium]